MRLQQFLTNIHHTSIKAVMAQQRLLMNLNHLLGGPSTGYTKLEQGSKFSPSYKQYLAYNGQIKSFMHDVPLDFDASNNTVNMVVEIPRWSHAKFEINTQIVGNPIVQDVKKGKVRFINNLFPHHGYVHNYGALPQTWEDTTNSNGSLNLYGDNDPLDVVEIGSQVLETGDIVRVKILASLALIDDGELDWKVFVINVNDPLASKLNGINDINQFLPGLLDTTREWFRNYKLPEGKPQNEFAFEGQFKEQNDSVAVVLENHHAWKRLIEGKVKGEKLPDITTTSIKSSPGYTETLGVVVGAPGLDSDLPFEVYESYYKK